MTKRAVSLDRDELIKLTGVEFSDDDMVELTCLARAYNERWSDPLPPDWMLLQLPLPEPRQLKLQTRRAFVEIVECFWRECRDRDHRGAHYKDKKKHAGPLVELLLALMRATGEPKLPSAATLFHDIESLHTGRERGH